MKKIIAFVLASIGLSAVQASPVPTSYSDGSVNRMEIEPMQNSETVPVIRFGDTVIPLSDMQIKVLSEAGVEMEDLEIIEVDMAFLRTSVIHGHN